MAMRTLRFVVKGSYQFPIDMLRYDRCYPQSEEDAGRIIRSFDPSAGETVVAVLQDHDSRNGPRAGLTAARWQSFGWQIVEEGHAV